MKCLKCGKMGHYKSECLEINIMGGDTCLIFQATTLMTQTRSLARKDKINSMWILCNNESTVDINKNNNMVTNIRHTNKPIKITGMGGEPIRIQQVGD